MRKKKLTSVIITIMMLAAVFVPQSAVFADTVSDLQNNDIPNVTKQEDQDTDQSAGDSDSDKKIEEEGSDAPENAADENDAATPALHENEGGSAVNAEAPAVDMSWYDASKDSFILSDEAGLAGLAKLVNEGTSFEGKTVELAEDIALTSEWTPIGTKDNAFSGTFNGKGKTISGLSITNAEGGYKGLFGHSNGTVKNFTITGSIGSAEAPLKSGTDNIGGAVGYNSGTVTRITGNVSIFVNTTSIYAIGGIVGQNGDDAVISRCINNADITGSKVAGGIAGRSYEKIDRCVNTGNITGNNGQKDGMGGIVGISGDKNGTYQTSVTNCYNKGTISNDNGRWHGGIVGMADSSVTITNCYDIGTIVKGYSWNWNPIIGHVDSYYSTVHDNYSLSGLDAGDTAASTQPNTIGVTKTAEEFKTVEMVSLLGGAYTMDSDNINDGYPVLDWQGNSTAIDGDITISKGGVYNISADMTGTITVSTAELVTLAGPGADKTLSNVSIRYTVPGANLRISGLAIDNKVDNSVIDFVGTGNSLVTIDKSVIDHKPSGYGQKALIHVPADGDLTISGDGTLYLYKSVAGAAIGGNNAEANGKITINSGTLFIKGTKQGAVIGTGANNKTAPGDITINGGNIYLIGNARGAAIGGAAGSTATPGGDVYINGGTLTINVDFSGAAIGGGGYDGGNDSNGGNLYISGGSVKTYIDENAIGSFGVEKAGVNDKAITADKMNSSTEKKAVAMLAFDTKDINTFNDAAVSSVTIKEGESVLYTGGLHEYGFINADRPKDDQANVTTTAENWIAVEDSSLYIYLTKEDHKLLINNQTFDVKWDSEKAGFTYEWAGQKVIKLIDEIGTVDISDECKARIDKAKEAYDALGTATADQAYVTNRTTLTNAVNSYAAMKVDEKIENIGTVTLEKEAQIVEAREAYKSLTWAQSRLVTKKSVLEEAEAKLAELKADKEVADGVIAKIDAIDDPVTLESKAGIDAARAAYDELTAAQKELVSNYAKLTAAEEAYKELKSAAEKDEADKAAAKAVSDMISKISDEVTLKDKAAVEDAEAAYKALTDDQKAKLTKAENDKLTDAVNKLAELMKPVEDAIAYIDAIPASITDSDDDAYSVLRAGEAYEKLSEDGKTMIPDAYKEKLEASVEKLVQINSNSGNVHAEGLDEYIRIVAEPVTKSDEFDAMKKRDIPKTLIGMYSIKFERLSLDGNGLVTEEILEFEEAVKVTVTDDAFTGYKNMQAVYQKSAADDSSEKAVYENIDVSFDGNTASVELKGSGNVGLFAEKAAAAGTETSKGDSSSKSEAASKTGDQFPVMAVMAVMLAAAGAGALAVRRRKQM